ncbi:hypothetical protein E2562_015142 [Oryza meyeriana var. granulata]|uniref:Uncharacterized protein n=1 Tax=Oryza meyeriana var. granulata TaxID=110450 RepID=A0A6G1DWY4_9ORYZ|nr:hypothetical protein E2562_015142 [Oryza meyeriana var. granulata]
MGRGKRSVFASLFGFKSSAGGRQDEEETTAARQQQQRYYGNHQQARGRTKVRPSDDDDDDYYGRHWYADRDINRRADEFIDRVHRGLLAGSEQEG